MMPLAKLVIIIYALLFIPGVISEEANCKSNYFPKSVSDCILSTADKEQYEFCCYTQIISTAPGSCEAFNYEKYNQERDFYNIIECNHAYSGCDDIKPEKASDCVVTQEDKNRNRPYCCYVVYEGKKSCNSYGKEDYEEALNEVELTRKILDKH